MKHECKFWLNKKSAVRKEFYLHWFMYCRCGKSILNQYDWSLEPVHIKKFFDENGLLMSVTRDGKLEMTSKVMKSEEMLYSPAREAEILKPEEREIEEKQ